MTSGNSVKPRDALTPIGTCGRLALAAALVAVTFIHGLGVIWAFNHLG